METLIDYLRTWEERRPDQILYRFVDADGREIEHYTYQSFAERTRELAAYLFAEAGLRPGDRALLVYPPGLEMVAAFIACARIGVIAVPVSPRYPWLSKPGWPSSASSPGTAGPRRCCRPSSSSTTTASCSATGQAGCPGRTPSGPGAALVRHGRHPGLWRWPCARHT